MCGASSRESRFAGDSAAKLTGAFGLELNEFLRRVSRAVSIDRSPIMEAVT
jgi:hypothetical protein